MLLNTLIRLPTTKRALVPGALACYAAVFGLLVYDLAVHARLNSWREASEQAVARTQFAASDATGASCAELAGMGQRLCNAEAKIDAKIDAARDRFQQRVAARKQHHVQPAVEHVQRTLDSPTPTAILPIALPDPAASQTPSIAARE
jgi:hypothetical protein